MPQGWDDTGQGRHRCATRLQKKQLEPRLDEAKAGQRVVFFVDAAHFVLAPYLGMLWCFARQFIRAPAGRQRFNVLGALNAVTHELILVTNDAYINADSVCDLLRRIAAQGLTIPITLILDNARYQNVISSWNWPNLSASNCCTCPLTRPTSISSNAYGNSSRRTVCTRPTTTTLRSSNRPSHPVSLKLKPHTRQPSTPCFPTASKPLKNQKLCRGRV